MKKIYSCLKAADSENCFLEEKHLKSLLNKVSRGSSKLFIFSFKNVNIYFLIIYNTT